MRQVVEFTRIIQPQDLDHDTLQSQISPDGRQAFIVTRKSEVHTDTNHFEILLLDLDTKRLAARPADPRPQLLYEVTAREDSDEADPALRDVRWAGNDTLVFRARLHDRPHQAYRLEVASRRLTQLSFEPLGVVGFDVSRDLRWVVYIAPVLNPPLAAGSRSIVVGTRSYWSVHFGQTGTRTQQRRYRYWVTRAGSRTARPLGGPFAESSGGWQAPSFSPDGRWVLLPRYEPQRQVAWGMQYPPIAADTATFGPSAQLDPLGYFSRPFSYVPRRTVAYRLADGMEQAVVDAPDDSQPYNQLRRDRLWQSDGRSVVIAGTFLPKSQAKGLGETSSHIIEYWPDEGRWRHIATLRSALKDTLPVPGSDDAFIALDGHERRRFERTPDGRWRESPDAGEAGEQGAGGRTGVRLRIEQALNQPPDVIAEVPGQAPVPLTHLNPQYAADTWGSMQPYRWTDAAGRRWEGGLMVPAGFNPAVRHALVIQTYGFSATRFYLDGANEYSGFTSGFAGRAFLRENLLVLALPWQAATGAPRDERGALMAFADGVKGAIEALVAQGLVDRDRVGILGWSATGERVLNLVTFSDAPVRAATLLDGDSNTLYSMTITYGVQDSIQFRKEQKNQGVPYGATRDRWVHNDPSLNTGCIRAALRIEAYGPEVHNNWDIYALLRRQYKPVELVMLPLGAHALSRPSERMISLQGNVDWYRFWLQGEERVQPVIPGETLQSLQAQYVRWRQMEGLKRSVDQQPLCARLAGHG
ncbi:MAG: hypothetical protein KF891_14970 [Rhizobacter sp.]|nr:hypothetical protein [Rhizobacter sp.]